MGTGLAFGVLREKRNLARTHAYTTYPNTSERADGRDERKGYSLREGRNNYGVESIWFRDGCVGACGLASAEKWKTSHIMDSHEIPGKQCVT